MEKVKIGDNIKSLHVQDAPERGWLAGKVTDLKNENGIEFVYFTASFSARNGERGLEVTQITDEPMRTPQNGTPSLLYGVTNHITIVPKG